MSRMTELEAMMLKQGFRPFVYRPRGEAWRLGWYHPEMMPNPRGMLEPKLGPLEVELRPEQRPSEVSAEAWRCELTRRRTEMAAVGGHG